MKKRKQKTKNIKNVKKRRTIEKIRKIIFLKKKKTEKRKNGKIKKKRKNNKGFSPPNPKLVTSLGRERAVEKLDGVWVWEEGRFTTSPTPKPIGGILKANHHFNFIYCNLVQFDLGFIQVQLSDFFQEFSLMSSQKNQRRHHPKEAAESSTTQKKGGEKAAPPTTERERTAPPKGGRISTRKGGGATFTPSLLPKKTGREQHHLRHSIKKGQERRTTHSSTAQKLRGRNAIEPRGGRQHRQKEETATLLQRVRGSSITQWRRGKKQHHSKERVGSTRSKKKASVGTQKTEE